MGQPFLTRIGQNGRHDRSPVAFDRLRRPARARRRRPLRRRGGRHRDVADRPRRRRRRPGGESGRCRARHRERPRRPRCPASTSTPRTCISAATGSTSRGSSPPATAPSRSGSIAPSRSSRKLNEHGVDVSFEDAVAKAGAADAIGRPHIARAAGAGPDLGPFFEEYLVPGAKAFVSRSWPSAEQAVELIHEAGGVAVVAHPYWDVKDPDQVRDLVESLVTRRRPRRHRDLLPAPHRGADRGTASSSARSSASSRPPPPTSTAPPTRPSPSGATTTPTGSASRRCRRSLR